MPGQYAGSRFGQDSYPRIATSADMLLEASAVLPYEPMYQNLVPFMPSIVNGSGSSSGISGAAVAATADGETSWAQYPDRLDLKAWQGDDVQIPLYFQNPGDPTQDMSDENDWWWKAQIRLYQNYQAPFITEFTIASEAIQPTPPDTVVQTLVTLYLPRQFNSQPGVYPWDLYSRCPFEGPVFPKPPSVADDEWPPEYMVKTWLYGYFYCVPRVTQTDFLPPTSAIQAGSSIAVTPTGIYGPNGRVP